MRDFRPALRTLLTQDAAVAAIVAARVYPIRLPQSIKDASIVYNRIDEETSYNMAGSSEVERVRVQVDSISTVVGQAATLANVVCDRLSGFRGTVDGVEFLGMFKAGGREDYDAGMEMYRVSRDYNIWYRSA